MNLGSLYLQSDAPTTELHQHPGPLVLSNQNLLLAHLFPEFDLESFCKFSGPLNYSRLRHLRLDGNNVTHTSMPDDTANCLRQASEIVFE